MDTNRAVAWVCCSLLCLLPVVAVVLALMRRGQGTRSPSGPMNTGGNQGWTPPAAPAHVPCPTCNATGSVPCSCGNGLVYENGQPRNHHLCGGSGKIKCMMCLGAGYRSM
ncbi:hypothetical protein [Dactylosporangium sp. CA-092794]|uniref:hypothetical protein n=1 Tax=Dactylosporangium sp. CA-092794 TaxID=3239929 RepID=UPI003D8E1EC1